MRRFDVITALRYEFERKKDLFIKKITISFQISKTWLTPSKENFTKPSG